MKNSKKYLAIVSSAALIVVFGVSKQWNSTALTEPESEPHMSASDRQVMPHSSDVMLQAHKTAANAPETRERTVADLNDKKPQPTVIHTEANATIDAMLLSIDEYGAAAKREELIEKLAMLTLDDPSLADVLSASLVDKFLTSGREDHKEILLDMMLIVPGKAGQQLGHELVNSTNHQQRLLGFELLRSETGQPDAANEQMIESSIWHDTSTDISVAAIDIIQPDINQQDNSDDSLALLDEVFDFHSSAPVRAAALMKIAAIDHGELTEGKLIAALDSNDQTLQTGSIMAIYQQNLVTPALRERLTELTASKSLPTKLQLAVDALLREG